jgi:hypothetical protein
MPADVTVYDPPGPDPMFLMIQRAATDPSFDMEKFQMLLTEYRNERETKARRLFNAAMAATQAEIGPVLRDRKNTHLGNRYATLDAMLDVILPVASAHGLNVRFGSAASGQPGWQCVSCIISLGDHTETLTLEAPVVVPPVSAGGRTQMTPIQAVGSTTTYLKRYLISNAFALRTSEAGTATDDDDGEATRRNPDTRPSTKDTPAAGAQAAQTTQPADKAGTVAVDHEAYKAAFRRRLHLAQNEAAIMELLDFPEIKAWIAAAPLRIQRDVDAMIEAKQGILKVAQAAAATEDPPALVGLLTRIEDADQATLDGMMTTPSFNEAMMSLTLPQQDRVDAAIKERGEILDRLKKEAANP